MDAHQHHLRRAMVISTVAMGALIALVLWSTAVTDSLLTLDIAVAVVSLALVPVVVRWPIAGGLLVNALTVLSPVATPPATFAALNAGRRRPFPSAMAVAVAGIAGHAVLGWWRPVQGLSYWWWLLLVAAAYAALLGWGTWAQAREALLTSLRERARRAEAEQGRRVSEARMAERTRIAREMHDVLAHRLSLLATYAGALEYRPDAPPERLAAAAGVIRSGVHQALEELREVITLLRQDPSSPDGDGVPGPGLAEVPRLIEEARDAGLVVRDSVISVGDVAPVTGRTAYRIVQEGLTNARKHAAGQPVSVTIKGVAGDGLTIDVRNPLSYQYSGLPGAGTGLVGLTERVSLAGGRLDHEVDAAGEFRLHAWLPWPT